MLKNIFTGIILTLLLAVKIIAQKSNLYQPAIENRAVNLLHEKQFHFKDLNKNVKTGRIISRLNSSSSLQILLDLRSVFAIEALYFTVESHVAIIYKVYVRSGLFSSSSTVSSSLLDPSN
jgi:hypothetical protein